MAQICGKWLKYLGNYIDIDEMAQIFKNGLSMRDVTQMYWNWLKHVENDLGLFVVTQICTKQLTCVRNDVDM